MFTRHGLRFTPRARTEASNKPDFIFPGEREYHDATFNAALRVMLGVKSTSKDRWRQVLTEADRIPQETAGARRLRRFTARIHGRVK